MIVVQSCLYDVCGGAARCHLVDMLTEEVSFICLKVTQSERLIVFLSMMLQCDVIVKKGSDIHRRL